MLLQEPQGLILGATAIGTALAFWLTRLRRGLLFTRAFFITLW